MQAPHLTARGGWIPGGVAPLWEPAAWREALMRIHEPLSGLWAQGRAALGIGGTAILGEGGLGNPQALPLLAYVPSLPLSALGDAAFCQRHRLRYAYVAGAMANGIASVAMVEAAARAGLLGFFGAAGLSLEEVEGAILTLKQRLGDLPFGSNLIHSPNETGLEEAVVALYLRHGVRLVSASAYMDLTLPLVHYRVKGIFQRADGEIVCPNQVVAKVSRVEVARKFFAPPPEKMLRALVEQGKLHEEEARLAAHIPMASDLSAEADSGGHTDNRSPVVLLPTMLALRDAFQAQYGYRHKLCVGLGGGIATPVSAAAAFAMGADYILTGTINQACVEAGTSPAVRALLAEAQQADVAMAPAADMFEMGVKVQVLKRGTMFAVRARKLYELYRSHGSLEEIPAKQREVLERDFFRCSLEEAWVSTEAYFAKVDPAQNARALRDPKHKMALVFRSYLGRASRWANAGEPTRKVDYQIWCGPAMGAFNGWTQGTFLAATEARRVEVVALNLLWGAAVLTRCNWLRAQGFALPAEVASVKPMPLEALAAFVQGG